VLLLPSRKWVDQTQSLPPDLHSSIEDLCTRPLDARGYKEFVHVLFCFFFFNFFLNWSDLSLLSVLA